MKTARNSITYVVFALLVGITLLASIQVWRQGIPTNSRTNHWAVRKIVAPEFAAEPPAAKLELAHDLEREFNRGVDIRDQVSQLDAESWKRFQDNFGEMMELWFLDKVDRYESFREDDRKKRFLETQIGRIKSWPVFERGAPAQSTAQDKDRLERLTEFLFARFRRLPPSQQQKIHRFLVAVWLQNSQLSQFIPGVF